MNYTNTETVAETFTVEDIGKVFDCFAADYDMMAQSTRLRDDAHVRATCHDVKLMAEAKYIREANIVLQDANGRVLKAAKYEIATEAGILTAERPGNSLWPQVRGGSLSVVVAYTLKWVFVPPLRKHAFLRTLRLPWETSGINLAFPGLARTADRDYFSRGYGLRKSLFQ